MDKCEEIGELFKVFTCTEWIFDNALAQRVLKHLSEAEKREFNFDVSTVQWKQFVQNHAYGIKKYILKEEAELPSVGNNDLITVSLLGFLRDLTLMFSIWQPIMEKITYHGQQPE